MKYEKEINEAYASIGFAPRDNQLEVINDILVAILDENKRHVILNAPTGTGKSLIGAVASECLGKIKDNSLASLILVHNNALAKQYYDTFNGNKNFCQLKGAGQYPCHALNKISSDPDEYFTAEECAFGILKDADESNLKNVCFRDCEYLDAKNKRNEVKHLITNYSYCFVDRMYADVLSRRLVTVWDEAHTINDTFTEHNAIYVSEKRLKKIANEVTEHLKLGKTQVYATIKRITDDLRDGYLNEKTYMAYLKPLYEAYKIIAEQCQTEMDKSGKNYNRYTKFSRLHKKYFGLGCKIDDLTIYQYEHVPQLIDNDGEKEFSIKPIFVNNMFNDVLDKSDYNIFMSATVSDEFLINTMNLDPSTVKFIKVKPSFPPENKKIVFFNPISLNYNSMKDEKVLKSLDDNVTKIINHHFKKNDSGIVLTPSFVVTERLAKLARNKTNIKVFEHVRGEKLQKILEQFKNSDEPSILLSPSMFEGIDLPDAISRFQIYVKAPYASLGDKRQKYILDKYPAIYELLTIKKIIQGAGRSVRHRADTASTYMLDVNIQRLFNSPRNIWKNEFSVNYSKILND